MATVARPLGAYPRPGLQNVLRQLFTAFGTGMFATMIALIGLLPAAFLRRDHEPQPAAPTPEPAGE